MTEGQNDDGDRLITRKEAGKLVGLSERTLRRMERAGEFPMPILATEGRRSPRHRLGRVKRWIDARDNGRSQSSRS